MRNRDLMRVFRVSPWLFPAVGLVLLAVLGFFREADTEDRERRIFPLSEPFVDIPDRVCDIRDYGAESSSSLSSPAINAAIDDCHGSGGGTVVVPEGSWRSGGIRMKSNIHLFLEEGSEITFEPDLREYLPVVLTRFQGIEFYNYAPLIYAIDSHDMAITGKGKLSGMGDEREAWTGSGNFEKAREELHAMGKGGVPVEERIFGETRPGLRPSFIQFVRGSDILLDGFTIENGPIWTIHPVYCRNVVMRDLSIRTWSGNTDGIVVDSTRDVLIERSFFSTGDDAIAIKSGLDEDGLRVGVPSENIRIRDIEVVKGSSGVSIGSEMSGGVRNVDIRDSSFKGTRHGFRIKSTRTRGGFIEDVRVDSVAMHDISSDAVDINFSYSSPLQSEKTRKPELRNIRISNISGSDVSRSVIGILGMGNAVMEGVSMENVTFTLSENAADIRNASGVTFKDIFVEAEESPMFSVENSRDIVFDGVRCAEADPCFRISGAKTSGIVIREADFSETPRKIEKSADIRKSAVSVE